MTKVVKVSDFTKFPGPRYRKLGEFSGEEFRDDVLIPAINQYGNDVIVDLDGTLGYGSSFLEECFGGLIRNGISKADALALLSKIKSEEDKSLILEIESYIKDALV